MPFSEVEQRRIQLTVSCRDTDVIPKVDGAGSAADGVQVMHNGVRVVHGGYFGDWMSEVIRQLHGHHEPQEELAFHAIVERLAEDTPEPVSLELGAFWAYYSLWVLQRLPGGTAFMVEPDPAHLEVGRRNFELNARAGTFLQAALGAEAAAPAPFLCESSGREELVATESLPSLFERFGLDHVDLLLADIQGAEVDLLEGGADLFKNGAVRFLLLSTHHHSISGDARIHQRCLDLLDGLGAHVIAEHTVAESVSGDGLIAVSFDPRDAGMAVHTSVGRVGESLFGDPLDDLAAAVAERDELEAELAEVRAALEATRQQEQAERDRATATARELDAIRRTRTWRLRNRAIAVLRRFRPR